MSDRDLRGSVLARRGRIARPEAVLSLMARLAHAEGLKPYRRHGIEGWTPENSAGKLRQARMKTRGTGILALARFQAAEQCGLTEYPAESIRDAENPKPPWPGKPVR